MYHMPFWQTANGEIREAEGSFARYVDSLAPFVDEISLCVPVRDTPAGEGTRLRARNVELEVLNQIGGQLSASWSWPTINRCLASRSARN